MITPTSGVGTTTGPTQVASSGTVLDKDDFLQLLVAQMRNQDPMNPMNSDELAAQLAQFSSLEQLMNINETLEGQGAATAAVVDVLNSTAALGVLGREVLAVGDRVTVTGQESETITVGVNGLGGTATLKILDEDGNTVGTRDVGQIEGGRQEIILGDAIDGLESGDYWYAVEVIDANGNPVEVQTFTRVRIDGVRYGPGGPVLISGDLEIPLGNVVEVITQG